MREKVTAKIIKKYDVAVCGGGFAEFLPHLLPQGQGKQVALFEKQYMLGGLGTAGLVTIYLPLCDGFGHQGILRNCGRIAPSSMKHGAEDKYPENWLSESGSRTEKDKRFEVQYNAQLFAILAEMLLWILG